MTTIDPVLAFGDQLRGEFGAIARKIACDLIIETHAEPTERDDAIAGALAAIDEGVRRVMAVYLRQFTDARARAVWREMIIPQAVRHAQLVFELRLIEIDRCIPSQGGRA